MRTWWVLMLIGVTACLEPGLVPCGDRLCPIGLQCVAGELCASGDQIAACDGLADGNACAVAGGAGACDRGVCVRTGCGNATVEVNEQCDDGNQTGGDGCSADCSKVEMCGDGFADEGEGCDDGNTNAADGCDACVRTMWSAASVLGGTLEATTIELYNPGGVAFDRFDNLYIADTFNHRIRRVDPSGAITTVAGDPNAPSGGDGGLATSAALGSPAVVAVDGLGNLYIAAFTIRRVDSAGIITTIASSLIDPRGIAVDGLGNLYFSDGDRIRRLDGMGVLTTIAGGTSPGITGDGGPATSATLAAPRGLAFDSDGNLFVADTNNHRVRRISTSGVITTVAGTTQGFSGDNGDATTAQLRAPSGLAFDSARNLYIADTGNNRVRRVTPAGTITTVAGNGGNLFSGDGGPAIGAGMYPRGVAIDSKDNLYIADERNHRIRRVDSSGVITTVAGNGIGGYIGQGNSATSTNMQSPAALAVGPTGAVYMSDTGGQRVFRMDPDGVVAIVAGSGLSGYSGDGGAAAAAQLHTPWGIAVGGTNVYIADSANDRIRRVDAAGVITTVAGNGTYGSAGDGGPATSAQLGESLGVAYHAGNLYIADTYVCKIRRVDSNGVITTIAGTGTCDATGDGGPATSATVSYPAGIAVDSLGNIIVADTENQRIRMVSTTGTITTIAGTGTYGYSGDGGLATNAQLGYPYAVATDAANNIYIADRNNEAIRRVDKATGVITTIGGGAQGYSGDGAAATAATMDYVLGVGVDAAGNVYMDDTNQRVRRIDTAGIITSIAGRIDPENMGPVAAARLANPQALVVSPSLTLIAGGITGTVQAVRANPAWLEVVIGRYPQNDPTGTLARFRDYNFGDVSGVALDEAGGKIYISESTSNQLHLVTVVDPANENTWTIAPINTDTTTGFADGPLATARFSNPTGLHVDVANRQLYVADTGNHVVRAIDLAAGTVRTVAGVPLTRGYFGDGGAATSGLLFGPRAITRCGNGDLFIADTLNQRIRRVAATDGTISTVLGDGVAASSGDGSPASSFPVHSPLGLACDATGNLFVTSTTTVRLLPANAAGVVDGTGAVQTIYGAPPRDTFPASVTSCLTGLAVVDATRVQVTDSCTGLLVELRREAAQ